MQDTFTAADIKRLLTRALSVTVEDTVTSTNDILKARGEAGETGEQILIARRQTAGKGRLGRSFYSPRGTGLYISVLLHPDFSPERALSVTTAAAVAVAGAIEELTGKPAGIKWVNDVYLEGKKVCGILTEAAMEGSSGALKYAVLGIGVNVLEPSGGFPENIRDIAGALFDDTPPEDTLCRLTAGILNRFFALYDMLPDPVHMAEYRRCSILDGLTVHFSQGNASYTGTVLGIDDEARLCIRLESGEEKAFSSGEVAIEKDFLDQLRER